MVLISGAWVRMIAPADLIRPMALVTGCGCSSRGCEKCAISASVFPAALIGIDITQTVGAARIMGSQLKHTLVGVLRLGISLGVPGTVTLFQQIVDAIVEGGVRFPGWLGYRLDWLRGTSFGFRVLGFEDSSADIIPDALGQGQPGDHRQQAAHSHRNEYSL